MDFDKGQRVGEMHGHEPSSSRGALVDAKAKPIAIIRIDDALAAAIAVDLGTTAVDLKRDNKHAYAVASDDMKATVLYFHDDGFFLTTLAGC